MRVLEPTGHAESVERLFLAARSGRLPHALAFEGPEGIGKFLAATWFAVGLLCAEGPGVPCGVCGPCKRVASDNHPDLFVIDPVADGEEQLRLSYIAARSDASDRPEQGSLEEFLDLRAVEGERRVVLLRSAERMNTPAQNALLKTLEEPRPGVVLVLETHRPERLLPTIRSRCVRVRFRALTAEECRAVLAREELVREPELLARWTEGSPGLARDWEERNAAGMLALLAEALAGRRTATSAAQALWDLEGRFRGDRPTRQARDRARFAIDLMLRLLADAARRDAGRAPDELALGAFLSGLPPVRAGQERRSIEALFTCRADIDRNLGPEAVLERALLALAERGRILART